MPGSDSETLLLELYAEKGCENDIWQRFKNVGSSLRVDKAKLKIAYKSKPKIEEVVENVEVKRELIVEYLCVLLKYENVTAKLIENGIIS